MDKITYDFDCVVDRHHTCATKFDEMDEKFGRHDLLPFWIADMDFEACPAIIDALRERLNHAVLGYTMPPAHFWESITRWLERRHGWSLPPENLTFLPGLKKGLGLCINFFTRPGDAIIIQPPVYHSFRSVIEGNGRRVVTNPLVPTPDGSYRMDFDSLERTISDERPAMMLVCNPHNPIGLQWDAPTLARLAGICRKAGIILISDEIYGDMMLDGTRHIPTATVSPEAAEITVTLGAPSKTFNIPGIVSAWTAITSEKLRRPFFQWLDANEFNAPPIAAMVATEAAYTHGEEWLDQALEYLRRNVDFAADFIAREIPLVKFHRPQASFAVWLDFSALRLSRQDLIKLLVERARLALSEGSTFGAQGEGFMRMNIGVPRSVLALGLNRLRDAVDSLANGTPLPADDAPTVPFAKMHGLGNNFVYVDCFNRNVPHLAELAVEMSRRHTGVGTDGIIAILPPTTPGADCRMRIFNADGSEARMCGNGIRCVAKYIFDNRIVNKPTLAIETLSGIRTVEIHPGIDGLTETVTVDMGLPVTDTRKIPVTFDADEMIEQPVTAAGQTVALTAVSTGNPHGVVFVDNFDNSTIATLGPTLETHPIWPDNANIEFVKVHSPHSLSMRAWERGAGETMACGTGACAAAHAAVITGRAQWPVSVNLIGGHLDIDRDPATGHILMTGPAVTILSGEFCTTTD